MPVRILVSFPPGSLNKDELVVSDDFSKVCIYDVATILWRNKRYIQAIATKLDRYGKTENFGRMSGLAYSHGIELNRLKEVLVKMCHRDREAKNILEENIDALITLLKETFIQLIDKRKDKAKSEFERQMQLYEEMKEQFQ